MKSRHIWPIHAYSCLFIHIDTHWHIFTCCIFMHLHGYYRIYLCLCTYTYTIIHVVFAYRNPKRAGNDQATMIETLYPKGQAMCFLAVMPRWNTGVFHSDCCCLILRSPVGRGWGGKIRSFGVPRFWTDHEHVAFPCCIPQRARTVMHNTRRIPH